MPLNVFFTVDVEIWPEGWDRLDERFPGAFRRYIYGPTGRGDYGLPMTLQILNDHGLRGAFFIEALFALRFGIQPLTEIVGLIQGAGHEVHLHLHPEWVDKLEQPLFPKRRGHLMRSFSLDEQSRLIQWGLSHLRAAGAPQVKAFRAGGYGFNAETLQALAANGVAMDTSYNPCVRGETSGIEKGGKLWQAVQVEGVYEYPVSAFEDWPGHFRPAQLAAASYGELTKALVAAEQSGWESFVMVSHGFELLDRTRTRPDPIVVQRFRRLCRFLERHRDLYPTQGFLELAPRIFPGEPQPIQSNVAYTVFRVLEQASRRVLA
ncbi:polysaccharide deacetylase [Nitrosococcus halophilus Nc 4]|uniref:Polysaccharide deacetylase n=1 Tax=Nitrosococcus halophilus (strain Nc4) TaxID=472759 RepID=D5C024_NITHN|nr:polysaccharide deacetylase [Nitrosococcus halophilus]ADE16271.1 polysaccharide deacetylase [Nitrosococcus halophilus Nc 4]